MIVICIELVCKHPVSSYNDSDSDHVSLKTYMATSRPTSDHFWSSERYSSNIINILRADMDKAILIRLGTAPRGVLRPPSLGDSVRVRVFVCNVFRRQAFYKISGLKTKDGENRTDGMTACFLWRKRRVWPDVLPTPMSLCMYDTS